jgi:hypothetical protein
MPVEGALRVPGQEALSRRLWRRLGTTNHRGGNHVATLLHAGRAAHSHPPPGLKKAYNQELALNSLEDIKRIPRACACC